MATLQFKGKSAVWNHHLSVPYHTLEKDAKKSLKGTDMEENLIIEGDNLLALKSLLPNYQGRIKCIYIDPPYNTGNEGWVYSDNVNSPTMQEWVGKIVGKDGEDLTRHDKWLCMMAPRLKLLRELLTEDGAIFISIDDNEQHHLKSVLNEIFGEDNFLCEFIWNKKNVVQNDAKFASTNHEYVLAYRKSRALEKFNLLARSEEANARYENPDNDPRGQWTSVALQAKSGSDSGVYEITFPNGITWKPASGTFPRLSKDSLMRAYKDNRLWFGPSGKNVPRLKKFLNEVKQGMVTNSLLFNAEVGSTQSAKEHLKDLMGDNIFETPKPIDLIKRFINLSADNKSIILDSFAGSGTMAEAVLELNKEDGGNRRFVMVQLSEKIAESTPAYRAGYRWVHEITQERVKRVIAKNKYKTGFSYYTLGSAIDAESILTGKLPTYKEFAKYVYYLATGKNHPDEKKIKEEDSFVGKTDHQSVYLIYDKNADELKKIAITLDWAQKTHKKDTNKKIVYAPACYLDDEALEQFNIKFVNIPYNLFERAI